MTSIKAENRELDALDINQPKESPPRARRPAARGYYLALTFGTLLSSQGADAQQSGPRGLSSLADCPTIHRTRMFPAPGSDPVPSRAGAVHGEQYTKLSGPAGALPPVLLCPTWSTTRARRQTFRLPLRPAFPPVSLTGADRSALRRTGATTRPSPGRFPLRATSVTARIRRSLRRPPVGGIGR